MVAPVEHQGGPAFGSNLEMCPGAIGGNWGRGSKFPSGYGQNWGDWRCELLAVNVPLRIQMFVPHSTRPPHAGPHSASGPNGRAFGFNVGRYSARSMGQHYGADALGHPYGGVVAVTRGPIGAGQKFGPSGLVRPRPNDG